MATKLETGSLESNRIPLELYDKKRQTVRVPLLLLNNTLFLRVPPVDNNVSLHQQKRHINDRRNWYSIQQAVSFITNPHTTYKESHDLKPYFNDLLTGGVALGHRFGGALNGIILPREIVAIAPSLYSYNVHNEDLDMFYTVWQPPQTIQMNVTEGRKHNIGEYMMQATVHPIGGRERVITMEFRKKLEK